MFRASVIQQESGFFVSIEYKLTNGEKSHKGNFKAMGSALASVADHKREYVSGVLERFFLAVDRIKHTDSYYTTTNKQISFTAIKQLHYDLFDTPRPSPEETENLIYRHRLHLLSILPAKSHPEYDQLSNYIHELTIMCDPNK